MRYGLAATVLLAFSFILQLAFILEQRGTPTETFFRDNAAFDSSRFLADARVIETEGLNDGMRRRQLHAMYPLIIAGFESVAGRAPVALLLFQALLNCAMFFMVWRLARRWFSEGVALAALFLCVFYVSFVFYAGVWLREITAVFLAVAVLALLDEMEQRGRWPFAAAAGIAAGLLMETRPYPILLGLVIAALTLAWARSRTAGSAAAATAFAAGCAVVMAALPGPGIAGEAGPLAHFLSGNVLDGAYGYLWLATPTKERLLAESGGGLFTGLWLFLGEVARQPLPYAAFYFKKLRMLFGDFAIPSNYNIYLFKDELSFVLHVPFVTFGLVFPFAAVGLWEGWRERRLRWLYLITFALTLGVFIFPIQERYRLIIVPFFIVFAAAGMGALFGAMRGGNARKGAYLAALFLAALIICRFDYWPLNGTTGAGDYRNLAIAYRVAGDDVKARYYEKKAEAVSSAR